MAHSLVQLSWIISTGLSQAVGANSLINTAALVLIIVMILACGNWQKRRQDHGDFPFINGR